MVQYAYKVQALVNVSANAMWGYGRTDQMAWITEGPRVNGGEPITFLVLANDSMEAAEKVWTIGQKMATDHNGRQYPRDIRSLCTGDLLVIERTDGQDQLVTHVDHIGFSTVETDTLTPPNPVVPIEGTHATSRK